MKDKTKNMISIILPLLSIFAIALTFRAYPTGFAVYEAKELYRLNGSISLTLEEEIPMDSYIKVGVDDYVIKVNIIDFVKKSGKPYNIIGEYIIANDTYVLDFASLGIIEGFEKGEHKIRVEMVHDGQAYYSDNEVVNI